MNSANGLAKRKTKETKQNSTTTIKNRHDLIGYYQCDSMTNRKQCTEDEKKKKHLRGRHEQTKNILKYQFH